MLKALMTAALLAAVTTTAYAEPFRIVALGDAPYGQPEKVYAPFETLIDTINARAPALVIHVGDTKSGSTPCSNKMLDDQLGYLNRFTAPVLYTPGDIVNITHTVPQHRQPWEIYVNLNGDRFVAEDEPSADARERVLVRQPALTFWAVFDDAIREAAPPFFHDIADDAVERLWNTHPSYVRDTTLANLAARMDVNAKRFLAAIDGYNKAQQSGQDPLGRRHMPHPIALAPFYAVKHHGISVVSFAGVSVDDRFRVRLQDGRHLPNLYAVGEMLGFATLNGNAYVSGMGVTPALTFGRLLGEALGRAK